MVIGGSSGIGIAVARRGRHAGAEVTITSRSLKKLIQVQSELEPVHTVVMDIGDEGTVEKALQASAASTMISSRPGPYATGRWSSMMRQTCWGGGQPTAQIEPDTVADVLRGNMMGRRPMGRRGGQAVRLPHEAAAGVVARVISQGCGAGA